jgi:chemotaxis protein MotA
MMTLPLGFILTIGVLAYSLMGVELKNFINLHSFVIVLGGTFCTLLLNATKINIIHLFHGLKVVIMREIYDNVVMHALFELAKGNKGEALKGKHELIDFYLQLMEQGLEKDMVHLLMSQKLEKLDRASETPVVLLKNLSKYPPALGMMGTCMGMVELFANLNADNKGFVGANLALAMTATFYGLVISNLLLSPLADRLHHRHMMVSKRNENVFNILLLILNNEPASVIENVSLEQKKAG